MRSVAARRFPTILSILFALIGIAAAVAIGRAIAAAAPDIAPMVHAALMAAP